LRLLLIRHAQTVWNAAGRVQGQADPPLSETGLEQCRLLGDRFAGTHIDGLVASDLSRAQLTAQAVGAATGAEVLLEPGLREVGLGLWEGIDRETLRRDYGHLYEQWLAEPTWDLVPEGEGAEAFRDRVVGALGRVVNGRPDGQTVVAVTHVGVIRLVLSTVFGLDARVLRWPWAIDNTGITALDGPADISAWTTPALRVTAVNDAAHLRRAAA
jgi:broad specificity phosphatase PhoE